MRLNYYFLNLTFCFQTTKKWMILCNRSSRQLDAWVENPWISCVVETYTANQKLILQRRLFRFNTSRVSSQYRSRLCGFVVGCIQNPNQLGGVWRIFPRSLWRPKAHSLAILATTQATTSHKKFTAGLWKWSSSLLGECLAAALSRRLSLIARLL